MVLLCKAHRRDCKEHNYRDAFGPSAVPEAYERLLLDAIKGDASLFARSDGTEHAWRLIDPVIQG